MSNALIFLKTILAGGLTIWSAISLINNILGFQGATHSISQTIGMAPLLEEPSIRTPLISRKLESAGLAKLMMVAILVLQFVATVTLAWGAAYLAVALAGGGDPLAGIRFATLGLGILSLLWIGLMTGGIWFAYWFRQQPLHMLHVALLSMTMIAAIAINA